MKSPIVLAVDTSDFATACKWIDSTRESISIYKLGLEFFLNFGAEGLLSIKNQFEVDIFLDLKLHDIPHTVAGAVKAISHLHPKFLTVHASGGSAMISEAVAAAQEIEIVAVTILTSLNEDDLTEIGFGKNPLMSAANLASLAVASGAKAIVCSPLEIQAIRTVVGNTPTIITPGVRPVTTRSNDDQKRTMTPRDALAAGANYLVIGRPITDKWSSGPAAMANAAREILSDLRDG